MYAAIVFLPLLGCVIAGLFGRLIGSRQSELVTTGLLFVSAALSIVSFGQVALGVAQPRSFPYWNGCIPAVSLLIGPSGSTPSLR